MLVWSWSSLRLHWTLAAPGELRVSVASGAQGAPPGTAPCSGRCGWWLGPLPPPALPSPDPGLFSPADVPQWESTARPQPVFPLLHNTVQKE